MAQKSVTLTVSGNGYAACVREVLDTVAAVREADANMPGTGDIISAEMAQVMTRGHLRAALDFLVGITHVGGMSVKTLRDMGEHALAYAASLDDPPCQDETPDSPTSS